MNDSPAFYDPATKTIFVSDDLKAFEHLYRFALRRSLTTALLDQQFDWSSRLSSDIACGSARSSSDNRWRCAGCGQRTRCERRAGSAGTRVPRRFVQGHGDTISPSQYAATITGRAGVAMRPTMASLAMTPSRWQRSSRRHRAMTPCSMPVVPRRRLCRPHPTQGMMFWYYVLASRIDDTQAWSAADSLDERLVETSAGTPSPCVDATFGAADADGAAVLLGRLPVVGRCGSGGVRRPRSPRSMATRSPSAPAILARCSRRHYRRRCPWSFGGAGCRACARASRRQRRPATPRSTPLPGHRGTSTRHGS